MFKNFFQPKTPKIFDAKEKNSSSGLSSVEVDGVTITGTGVPGNPLVAQPQALPYLVYTANLSQSGTNAPVATVLENTLGGTLVWTRLDAGQYAATLAGAFGDASKVYILIQGTWYEGTYTYGCFSLFGVNDSNSLVFYTLKLNDLNTYTDSLFNNTTVEIRVYP